MTHPQLTARLKNMGDMVKGVEANFLPRRNGAWGQFREYWLVPDIGVSWVEDYEAFFSSIRNELNPSFAERPYLESRRGPNGIVNIVGLSVGKLFFDEVIGEDELDGFRVDGDVYKRRTIVRVYPSRRIVEDLFREGKERKLVIELGLNGLSYDKSRLEHARK